MAQINRPSNHDKNNDNVSKISSGNYPEINEYNAITTLRSLCGGERIKMPSLDSREVGVYIIQQGDARRNEAIAGYIKEDNFLDSIIELPPP